MNFDTPRKNYTGIAFVTVAHLVAAFIAVKNSTITFTPVVPPVIVVEPVPDKPQPPKPKDEPKYEPKFDEKPIIVPPPIIETTTTEPTVTAKRQVEVLDGPRHTGPSDGDPPAGGKGEVAQRAAPVRVAPVIDARNCAKPAYPATALRNEETGTVSLAFLVGTDGKVASAKVERSSGSRDLDRAAVNGLSLCRFTPGSVDGVAYESWFRMQYVWSLD